MPAPSTLPDHDSTLANQPASYPNALQTEGFPDKYNAANTIWNYLFHWAFAWIRWLRNSPTMLYSRTQGSAVTNISSADDDETVAASCTLPAGTIPATGIFRLVVRGIYHANAMANATSIAIKLRIGPTTLIGDIFFAEGWAVSGTQGSADFEVTIIGESNGGTGVEGTVKRTSILWDGSIGGYLLGSGVVPIAYMPAGVDIDHTVANLIEVTCQWDLVTGSPDGRVTQFEVEFGLSEN
tara:strand:+ start:3211 stop:3927 length:717 start_codon:yes stop_codon:yes gene_type:complete